MDTQTSKEVQKIGYVGSLITPPQVGNTIRVFIEVMVIILGWLSITVEVFIRRNFGERYLSLLRLFLALFVLNLYQSFYTLISVLRGNLNPIALFWNPTSLNALFHGNISTRFYFLFWWGYVVMAALHVIAIKRREHQGVEWHSMSFGRSWLEELPIWGVWNWLVSQLPWRLGAFFKVDAWTLYCFVEPGLCYLASFPVYQVDGLLGTWLWVAAFALFIKNLMVYYEMRSRMLDLRDAGIEGKYLQAALQGESMERTAGFTVVNVPMALAEANTGIDVAATVRETMRPVNPVN